MRPGMGPSSFYDPISAGSSRRSSQLSTTTNGGVSIPPPPPSHLLAGQLQRLQSSPKPSRNLVLQTQSASLQQTAIQQQLFNANLSTDSVRQSSITTSSDTRRMSEPCHNLTERKSPPPRPASVTLSPLKCAGSSSELHPNQAVVLDEVGEGEMVENKLVIPDEMVHYLNQVADTQNDFTTLQWSDTQNNPNDSQRNLPSPSQIMSPANLNEILPSPPSNFNQILSPQQTLINTNVLSPVNTVMNQMIPSPSTNLTQMLPSPAPTMNPMASPASNFSQMASPASNFNQMIHSPSSNYGGTISNPLMSPTISNINHQPSLNGINLNPQQTVGHSNTNPMQTPNSVQISNPNNPMQTQNHMQTPNPMQTPNTMQSPNPMQTNHLQTPNPMASPSQSIQNTGQQQMIQQQQCNQMMLQNHQIVPNNMMNQCYTNQMQMNGMCYVQQNNWNGIMQQNQVCQNQMRPNDHHHNMCHGRNNGNANDYNQCNKMIPINNNYGAPQTNNNNNSTMQCGGNHHNYQMCNNTTPNGSYMINHCQIKPNNNYKTYSSMQSPNYSCMPNMIEPLASPAMATPAPSNDILSTQPQQAQMTRPQCNHYDQNCYRAYPNNQCNNTNNEQCSCNCRKMNMYHQPNKCYNHHHQCNKPEIQCKDISQSQMSPRLITEQNSQGNSTQQQQQQQQSTTTQLQPIGMRQDAYQRTLEYVQNCQSWVSNDLVSSSTHPLSNKCGADTTSNMVVNDMTSSLSSLLEENRYLQMIQ